MTRYVTDFLDRVLDRRRGFPVYIYGMTCWRSESCDLSAYLPRGNVCRRPQSCQLMRSTAIVQKTLGKYAHT
jgi:hypothetical protein